MTVRPARLVGLGGLVALVGALAGGGVAGCGGVTAGGGGDSGVGGDASTGEGGTNADGGIDFDACGPGVMPIPTHVIYDCDAEAPGGSGCPGYKPNGMPGGDGHTYPLGCRAFLPSMQSGCAGTCCGAQECNCDKGFLPDGGAGFLCPL